MPTKQAVAYGSIPYDGDSELTSVLEPVAFPCARVWRAVREAQTWSGLFRQLDPDEYEDLEEMLSLSEVDFDLESAVRPADIPGSLDGDYPYSAHVHCSS